MANDTAQYDPEPFEMIPHWLLLDSTLTANAKLIWLVLRKHRNYQTGNCWPGRARIAELCGVSLSTVKRELANLAKAGAITITPRKTAEGDSDTNLYHVHWERGGLSTVSTRGGVRKNPPRVRKSLRGGFTEDRKLIPIENKEVPQSILTMDDGPEHDAAYLRFIKGEG